jgi:signal-transduction protein with cAMP-binding, CBS, and nucleotidyltransferase domain
MTPVVTEHYSKDVATIPAEASAREAAVAMRQRAVGSLVVMRDGKAAGIITDRDLLERVIAEGKDASATATADIMSAPLRAASPEDPLDRVVELMSSQGIRRVPVLRQDVLVGMVALDDVVAEVAQELHDLAEGTRREITTAERTARTGQIARDVGERLRDLGEQLQDVGVEARDGLLRELDRMRERIRGQKR